MSFDINTTIAEMELGIRCMNMIRKEDAPRDWAALIYSNSLLRITIKLDSRAYGIYENNMKANKVGSIFVKIVAANLPTGDRERQASTLYQ